MTLKRMIFWAHLSVAVTAGLVILMMSVTGVLLTYERQIERWAENSAISTPANAAPLSPQALADAARKAGATPGQTLTIARNPGLVSVSSGRRNVAELNPYSGQPVENAGGQTSAFFGKVTQFHRWFALEGEARGVGKAIVGVANVLFLFLIVSGIVLWWPKMWTWRFLRTKLLFHRGASGRARDYNWHQVLSAWCLLPLAAIVVSGVVISYPFAGNLVYRAFGEEPPVRRGPPQGGKPQASPTLEAGATPLSLNRLATTVESEVPNYRRIAITLPADDAATVAIEVDSGNGAQRGLKDTFVVSRVDGAIVERRSGADGSPGSRARAFLRFLHTGEVYGLLGQTIAGLASLAAAFLVYTGLALSYRRLLRPLFTRRRS